KEQRMTDDEKADKLMNQLFSQMSIDQQYEKEGAEIDAEIERRLTMLRGQQQQGRGAPRPQALDLMNAKPKSTREVIEQILAQPDDHEMGGEDSDDAASGSECDDVWCATCTEDGVLRCLDCDNDIYCHECFR